MSRASRQRRWLHVFVAVCIVAVAGCGAGTTDDPTELRVIMSDDWVKAPAFVDAVRAFERAHPDVRVEIQSMLFEDVAEAVRSGINSGSPPDVAQWHAFAAGAQEMAEPLDDLWRSRLQSSELLPGAVEDVSWAGRRYGVPLDANAMLVIYDSDRLAARGVGPMGQPYTFSDLKRAARALTLPDGSQRAIGIPSSTWHAFGWIRANGGTLLDVDRDGRVRFTFEQPPVVEAVSFLAELVREGTAFPPTGLVGDRTDAFELLRSGRVSMHVSGSWDLASLRNEANSARYRVAPMPKGLHGTTEGTAMGGSSLFVPKGSRNRALAIEFMLLLTSDHYALRLAKEDGRLPVRLSLYRDPFFQTEDLRTFLDQLKSALPFKLEAFPNAHEAFGEALDDVLTSGKDVAAALGEAQLRAEASHPVR